MIPIGTDTQTRSFPAVMWLLVTANLGAFLYQLSLDGESVEQLIRLWGLVPSRLWTYRWGDDGVSYLRGAWLPMVSCMFLHGGWLHILGNLLCLRVFGGQIEDRLGHVRFLCFYVLCGLLASCLHVALSFDSDVPTIGASGAIAGVLGAYLLLFPFQWVRFIVPVLIFPVMVKLPAIVYLLLWIGTQVLGGYRALADGSPVAGGIAFWAHVGGFAAGMFWIRRWHGQSTRRQRSRKT